VTTCSAKAGEAGWGENRMAITATDDSNSQTLWDCRCCCLVQFGTTTVNYSETATADVRDGYSDVHNLMIPAMVNNNNTVWCWGRAELRSGVLACISVLSMFGTRSRAGGTERLGSTSLKGHCVMIGRDEWR
jgi:hypothetical protein